MEKYLPNLTYFFALICFNGSIAELSSAADFWIIPLAKLAEPAEQKISKNEKTVYISNKFIRENYNDYKNTLKWLDAYLIAN